MAFSLVQHKVSAGGGQSTITPTSATTTGNLEIIRTQANASDTISSISDSVNTWHKAVTSAASGSGQVTEIWYAYNVTGTGNAITVTFSAGNYHAIYFEEWSGAATAVDPLDGTGSATGTGTALATGSFAITSGDLVVGVMMGANGGVTVGSGFTNADTDGFSVSEYQNPVNASSIDVTATCTSGNWTISGAAFKVPAAAGVTYPQLERTIRGLNRGLGYR